MRMRRRRLWRKFRHSRFFENIPLLAVAILFTALMIKFLFDLGAGSALIRTVLSAFESEGFANGILSMELERGSRRTADELISDAALAQSAALAAAKDAQPVLLQARTAAQPAQAADHQPAAVSVPVLPGFSKPRIGLSGEDQASDSTEDMEDEASAPSQIRTVERAIYSEIKINNSTSHIIDVEALLGAGLALSAPGPQDEPQVLIIHTHGSESFNGINMGDISARSTDNEQNVVRLGSEIAEIFESSGISVIHDTGIRDYPSYNGSYTRTLAEIEAYLEMYPSIEIVIDVHRDAITDDEGNITKTVCQIGGEDAAQVMLVMGSDEGGLSHPLWEENLKLGLRLQEKMNQLFPGLARPLNLRIDRFNQHATTGSILVEIGCSGNTLDEAVLAARCFAEAAAEVILELAA